MAFQESIFKLNPSNSACYVLLRKHLTHMYGFCRFPIYYMIIFQKQYAFPDKHRCRPLTFWCTNDKLNCFVEWISTTFITLHLGQEFEQNYQHHISSNLQIILARVTSAILAFLKSIWVRYMMTSSNGNIFRVTGHLCGKFTGPRWISRTKASDAELWCFFLFTPE